MKRSCQNCGSPLYGRTDQRFCSDYCRNCHHNARKREENSIFRQINSILRKNRMVLQGFLNHPWTEILLWMLEKAGFHEGYFTSTLTLEDGKAIFICYDIGYTLNHRDEQMVQIFAYADDHAKKR